MNLITLDFETFWSAEHSLTKMSPIEYVLHPLTQIVSCSLKVNGGPSTVVFGESDVRSALDTVDWSSSAVVAHNMAGFDAMLLAWRFGVAPRAYFCTLAMARPVVGKVVGLSLASLVRHFGIGVKNAQVLHETKGRRLEDFTKDERCRMAVYNAEDTDQCYALFQALRPHFSTAELWHIDCNIRMLVEPEFCLDTALLGKALLEERTNKRHALMQLAGLLGAALPGEIEDVTAERVRSEMASAAKFAALLQRLGVEVVPLKRSKTDPTKKIPAIAKDDEAMALLLESDDAVVAAAARARLSAKSTQLETRIELFLSTHRAVGRLPVPAHYCGADTTGRDSGFLYNMYNLPRINKKKPKTSDALRLSVLAPEGRVIGVADQSGIELRVNHTLWQVARSTAIWRQQANADLYKRTAADYYDVAVEEVSGAQRQFAKVLELSCGFGIGPEKFRQTARVQGGLSLSLEEAVAGVRGWRSMYREISDYEHGGWGACQQALEYIAAGQERAIDPLGLCHTTKDAIVLPSGRLIRYPDLRREVVTRYTEVDGNLVEKKETAWVYAHGRHKAFLYGGKVDENIVQALARDIIFPNAIEFWKQTGLRPKHKVYDELVYLFTPDQADGYLEQLQTIMRASPKWWPQIVLWSEGSIADCYGKAK